MDLDWRDLLRYWNDPGWIRDRLEHRVSGPVSGLIHGFGGIDVPSADWDNLIILDACRADLFESACDLDAFDGYRRVTSRGSSTEEWVLRNWVDGEFPDTVYVTANPTVARYTPEHFNRRVDVFETDFDDDRGTVLPGPVAERAREAFERDKRLVAHFMQPHYPFYKRDLGIDSKSWHPDRQDGDDVIRNPWEALRKGGVPEETLVEAYRATLEDALPSALELAADLPGTSVVTSDHGNTYGRWAVPLPIRIYGHPSGFRYPELVEVPWGRIEGDRREIEPGRIAENVAESDVVRDRLEAFGYVESGPQ